MLNNPMERHDDNYDSLHQMPDKQQNYSLWAQYSYRMAYGPKDVRHYSPTKYNAVHRCIENKRIPERKTTTIHSRNNTESKLVLGPK